VLVPLRGGTPTGALRFDITAGDPTPAARAWIGALGRFGRPERLVIALLGDRGRSRSGEALVGALADRARDIGLPAEVVVVSDPSVAAPLEDEASATRSAPVRPTATLLPVVRAEEALSVAAEVDTLLDRHPRAQLPAPLLEDAIALLLAAAARPARRLHPRTLAVLIVCAQRDEWRQRALHRLTASAPVTSRAASALVARAAAVAPTTERCALLVLLASLHWASGRVDPAAALAQEALRLDPHDHAARLLAAALERGEPCPWTAAEPRAA